MREDLATPAGWGKWTALGAAGATLRPGKRIPRLLRRWSHIFALFYRLYFCCYEFNLHHYSYKFDLIRVLKIHFQYILI